MSKRRGRRLRSVEMVQLVGSSYHLVPKSASDTTDIDLEAFPKAHRNLRVVLKQARFEKLGMPRVVAEVARVQRTAMVPVLITMLEGTSIYSTGGILISIGNLAYRVFRTLEGGMSNDTVREKAAARVVLRKFKEALEVYARAIDRKLP